MLLRKKEVMMKSAGKNSNVVSITRQTLDGLKAHVVAHLRSNTNHQSVELQLKGRVGMRGEIRLHKDGSWTIRSGNKLTEKQNLTIDELLQQYFRLKHPKLSMSSSLQIRIARFETYRQKLHDEVFSALEECFIYLQGDMSD